MRRAAVMMLIFLCQAAAAAEGEKFQIEVDPRVYSPKDFAGPDRKVQAFPQEKKSRDALPDRKARDAAFARVPGLESDLAGMDHLERDLLFVRAKTRSLAALKKAYPKIPEGRLRALQAVLKTTP